MIKPKWYQATSADLSVICLGKADKEKCRVAKRHDETDKTHKTSQILVVKPQALHDDSKLE